MKLWKKILLAGLALFVSGTSLFCVPTLWGTPWKIEHFYMRTFANFALRNPELLSGMRLLEPMGLSFHNDDLADRSIAETRRNMAFLEESLGTLHSYEREEVADKLSYDVFEWFIEDQARGREFAFYDYPVNQLFGVQSGLPDFMINTHVIDGADAAEDYLTRVSKFAEVFDQVLESMDYRESIGVLPPKFVMTRVLKEMREFVATPATEHVLYTHLDEKLRELESIEEEERAAMLARLAAHLNESVYPAYGKLIAWFEAREDSASTDDGVWKFPRGDEFYAWKVRSFTTTEMSPEEVHQLGLAQVALIQGEMTEILRKQGYAVEEFGSTMQALNEEPRFLYADSDEGRAQILADYQKIIDDIDANMDEFFANKPEAKVAVERVPEFKQETAPGAYYNQPPFDGSKPGIFYANLRSVKEIPRFGMRTLAYHEAIPGHHYQIARAQELEGVPFFRKVIPFTAYVEGWALYAEQVAAEQGFMDDPFDRLGFLTAQLFRANRLVVDTGLHHKKWTRQSAIDYMLANTGMPKTDVVAEIERYIVMPGQALAYKVGQLEILRLRDKAKRELGDTFDIKDFHEAVLQNGALPLSLLAQVVEEYIASAGG
jgi:uncharacterized protein (DUF885 family)